MTRPIFAFAMFAGALLVATQAPAAGAPDWAARLVKSAEDSAAAAAKSADTAAKSADLIAALIPDYARRVAEAGDSAPWADPAAYAADAVHSKAEYCAAAAERAAEYAAGAHGRAAAVDFDAGGLSGSVRFAANEARSAANLADDAMHWFTEAVAAEFGTPR